MARTRTSLAGLLVTVAVATPLLMASAAHADYAPSGTDVIGVGGETPQFAVDFAADGDTAGDLGYNAAGNVNRLVSFDATADSNGRGAYANGSTLASPKPLNPTVVLRAGSNPVQRPSGTGAGYSALLADTGPLAKISFIRASAEPTAAQQQQAASNGWGFLHVVQLGTDPIQIVAATSTHAPAGLSPAELVGIYKGTYLHWSDLPGNSGGSTDAIIPEIPLSTSSVTKQFLADLKQANGGVAVTLNSNVVTVEQNDPTSITGLGASASDGIVPFAIGRLALWNSGYFHDPTVGFPGGAVLTPGVVALTAAAPDGASSAPHRPRAGRTRGR